MKPTILAIAGPSGSGKSYLSDIMVNDHNFQEIVSTTTRKKRENETEGVHYHFTDNESFEKMLKEGKIIEYTKIGDKYYGINESEPLRISKNGSPVVIVVDPTGIKNLKKYCKKKGWNYVSVFVNSPINTLIERLESRKIKEISLLDKHDGNYSRNKESIERIIDERKDHIINFEFKNWVSEATSEKKIYDIIFDKFNNENQNEVIDKIRKKVDKQQKKNLKMKY